MGEQLIVAIVAGVVGGLITLIFTLFALAVAWGRINQRLDDYLGRLVDVEDRLNTRRGGVVTKDSFDDKRKDCRELIFSEVAHVKETCEQTKALVDDIIKLLNGNGNGRSE